ncbi:MAG: YopX family protein [Spirochaetes bacterium]|nr:YopX family protein [Spirochaetota bacterium]
MKVIKFKGRALDSSEWAYGYLLFTDTRAFIHPIRNGLDFGDVDFGYGFIEVDPKTVGQFTGIDDKNGTEIYEGDIVKAVRSYGPLDQIAVVEAESPVAWSWGEYCTIGVALTFNQDTEVIGNIHENPELLEK